MSELYGASHRALQRQSHTERLAVRVEQHLRRERFTAEERAFIESRDLFFLATADRDGRPAIRPGGSRGR